MHSPLIWNPPFELNFGFPSKGPTFRTIVQTPASARGEIRASLQVYPIWEITYDLQHARGNEQNVASVYQFLVGFFLAMGGQHSDFLYLDPGDNEVDGDPFAVVAAGVLDYQLTRSIGIGTDIVQNVQPGVVIYGDGEVLDSATYDIGPTGVVSFTAAPTRPSDGGAVAVLSWSGKFWYRVRFGQDDMTFDQFVKEIWESKSLKLRSVILGESA